jgi:hypothetical protein
MDRQKDGEMIERQKEGWVSEWTVKEKQSKSETHAGIQTDRQVDRQTSRQKTDRKVNREKHRQTDKIML